MVLGTTFRKRQHKLFVLALDILAIYASFLLSHWIVTNFNVSEINFWRELYLISLFLPIYLVSFLVFKLDRSLWRFASVDEAVKIVFSTFDSFIIIFLINLIFNFSD